MTTRFETVDDILGQLLDFHQALIDYYQRRASSDRDERLRMLADYLVERQQRVAAGTEGYRKDADTSRRETWFDKVPDLDPLPALRKAMAATDADQLLNAALELDRHLLGIYDVMRREASHGELHALFEDLHSQLEQEQRLLATSAARMRDL
ncbi:MAG TPA: hypothetical protein VL027_10055 [Spongiibacteraceae bacterium]|jgi:hypothetical protein|nr:hypothetical protein [Spongiibacteraceae bacterium]HUH38274.1 hypothetical protein [Spongiibacteraceae bacterium]